MIKLWTVFKSLPWWKKILVLLPFLAMSVWLAIQWLYDRTGSAMVGREAMKKHFSETMKDHDNTQAELEKEFFEIDKQEREIRNEIERIRDNFNSIDNDVDRAINADQLQMLYDRLIRRAREQRNKK